jgi:glycosyltransferase involved in cell wall biosynthesis
MLNSLTAKGDGQKVALLIAYAYPPFPAIGSVRPAGLAKYLPRYGWTPVVLTAQWDGFERCADGVIETQYRDVMEQVKQKFWLDRGRGFHELLGLPLSSTPRKPHLHTRLLDAIRAAMTYPDQQKGWIPFACAAITDLARKQRVDAIISTVPPFTAHLVAARAQKLLRCPWVADYRDLWNIDPVTMGEAKGVAALVRHKTEKQVLSEVDALVTVSEPCAERLRSRYPEKRVVCITNGFDEDEAARPNQQLSALFTITYTGQLYQGGRDPSELLFAITELLAEGKLARDDVRLRFYGPAESFLAALVSKHGLQDVVELHAHVPRPQALELQRQSQVLLLLPWWSPEATGVLTGKLFEYLGAARPILAIGGGRGALADLLEETNSGVYAVSRAEIKRFLCRYYDDFKRVGCVSYDANPHAVAKYTHNQMACKFAALLHSLSAVHHSGAPTMAT